ncbi:hypothetical protein MLD38_026820 [Melastoma candidum]|uniref:Uncharacterized protein n=1 Tax=Melastoma candidum TaxID=119954 RepID=A0ACB9P2P7_9MYRT|nr:hypothetical protein MLD38_026820 [Melastoma candidum]
MHKVLQILQCSGQSRRKLDKYCLVRNCLASHLFDSSPVDFTSDFGHWFLLPPSILKRPLPAKALSWIVKSVSSGLDTMYLTRFASQRVGYWNNLHSSASIGAPYLIII